MKNRLTRKRFSLKWTQKVGIVFLALIFHILLIIILGNRLHVAANYFIIIPIIAASYCFGLPGGFISGTLGLSINLSLFILMGHIEWGPVSHLMAQIAGMTIGFGLGLTGSYLQRLMQEVEERKKREGELVIALKEKEILYKELNHRVKNNLNIIKSLIQLQIYRTNSHRFKREGEKLINRILSISLVHEQLYSQQLKNDIDLRIYLKDLVNQILTSHKDSLITLDFKCTNETVTIALDRAIPLGLIVNELITNTLKYAFEDYSSITNSVNMEIREESKHITLQVGDNGIGFTPESEENGLGTKLIESLTKQLGGSYSYMPLFKGTNFVLTFPRST